MVGGGWSWAGAMMALARDGGGGSSAAAVGRGRELPRQRQRRPTHARLQQIRNTRRPSLQYTRPCNAQPHPLIARVPLLALANDTESRLPVSSCALLQKDSSERCCCCSKCARRHVLRDKSSLAQQQVRARTVKAPALRRASRPRDLCFASARELCSTAPAAALLTASGAGLLYNLRAILLPRSTIATGPMPSASPPFWAGGRRVYVELRSLLQERQAGSSASAGRWKSNGEQGCERKGSRQPR